MLSDAPVYNANRGLQAHDTEIFLSSIVRKMDWSRQEHDVVMDIGCGTGNSIGKMLSLFPKVKKLIAIDVLPTMIEFAKKNNSFEKTEYHVSNIEDRCSIEQWFQQISKVISIHCFNWLGNQKNGFKNIYYMLKLGGQAALLFMISTPFWDSYELHMNNPKWKKYLENANPCIPESHFKKYDASYYRCLLEGIGFNVIICEDENRTFAFPNDQECRDALSPCALTSYIPDELKSEFKEDLFQGCLKYNGRDSDGKPILKSRQINILIQKPTCMK